MTAQSQRIKKQQRLVKEWNRAYPVGTPVRYWTGVREGEGRIGETRSKAELLGGHTAVVWVTGTPGCVSLSHVEPLVPVPLEDDLLRLDLGAGGARP